MRRLHARNVIGHGKAQKLFSCCTQQLNWFLLASPNVSLWSELMENTKEREFVFETLERREALTGKGLDKTGVLADP